MVAEGEAAALEFTPTWIVAAVCSVIVLISLVAERCLHFLGKKLQKKNQRPLYEALLKVKEELMLLGFISLLLTVFQGMIQRTCIPASWTIHMLPCQRPEPDGKAGEASSTNEHFVAAGIIGRIGRRLLSESASGLEQCQKKGKVPLLSLEAIHQLHIFIFVLAITHVIFSVTTMLLGGAQIHQWKLWETGIQKDAPGNGPKKVTHVRTHEFIKKRFKGIGKDSRILSWLHSFGKQFYRSLTKTDYTTMRLGFIMTHCPGNPKFDFHRYMVRVLEADFKKVVGISWYLWIFVVIFLLLNVNGWHTYFWIAFLPLFLLLAIGTKLEHVIAQLAHDVAEKHTAVEGDVVVIPSDRHFWFGKPRIILYLIHFILFQNAFEIAFFFWILSTYGFDSCIMGQVRFIVPRLVIGVVIQLLCSYSTMPLYAIVTQMGTSYKKEIFNEHVQQGVLGWAQKAKMRKGLKGAASSKAESTSTADSAGPSVKIEMAKAGEDVESETWEEGSKGENGRTTMAAAGEAAELQFTPTWIVAAVCSIIVVISLAAERGLHHLGKTLKKNHQRPLYEALLKVKEELMLLGFISLLLTVFERTIERTCIPPSWTNYMLPCQRPGHGGGSSKAPPAAGAATTARFIAGEILGGFSRARVLSEGEAGAELGLCQKEGKVPLLSEEALDQLHIFIFVLAVSHVFFSATTMLLGGAKIHRWKKWEEEIQTTENEPKKVLPVHQLSFVRGRCKGGPDSKTLCWLRSFRKQFYGSVTRSDYAALRHGFIMTHCPGNPKFDFHKYMVRVLESDFKKIVGTSWCLWIFVVIFLLLNVNGWHTYFWIAFLPLALQLAVGTKLEHVIAQLAYEVAERQAEGDSVVKPSDEHFWFGRPRIILHVIHFILFQNAFELSFFFWILMTYGLNSCFMDNTIFLVPRLVLGVVIQLLCSYSTLPLYAIVTQMGSYYKMEIFNQHVQQGVLGWAEKAKKRSGDCSGKCKSTHSNNAA
ncbi:hypothetical protein U9M48_044005 [Paspalum notatum var. saurae]|uniref:MLO-like protein n=1 Tax=Paspalum notatum var. saurae TaxID=547442 RepID=A0AAQ3XH15_PASNO